LYLKQIQRSQAGQGNWREDGAARGPEQEKAEMLRTASVFLQTLKDGSESLKQRSLDDEQHAAGSSSPHRAHQISMMSAPGVERAESVLISKMSNMVRNTNDSMNSVLQTLHSAQQ
jgi:hypothetical protein